MPATIDLTVTVPMGNGAKLDLNWSGDILGPNDDLAEFHYQATLRMNSANGSTRICTVDAFVRDGISTQLIRQASPAANLDVNDPRRYFQFDPANQMRLAQRSTPTGYTDLINAWRAANSKDNRAAAFKAHLLSAAHIDSSFAGT